MNPRLDRLQPYPFERLRALLAGVPTPSQRPIRLSIGEPQHATPEFVRTALADHFAGLSSYPLTVGLDALREANLDSLSEDEWQRTQLVFVCSPGNPTGHVLDLHAWRTLFEYSDRYGL
jgi:aspartate/methionine/tyrosine aminotransferase